MSIPPLLPGRVPNSLAASRYARNIQLDQTELAKLQEQLSTGQKFLRPGEAPGPATRAIILQSLLERKQTVKENIVIDRGFLVTSESALGSVSDALNRAKSLAQSGTGDTATDAEKQAMAMEVASLIRGVVNAGNATYQGRYLFGGSQSTEPPLDFTAAGDVRYRGDTRSIQSFVDIGLLMANNLDGQTALGVMTDPVGSDVNPALTTATKIADLYGGAGVKLDAVQVTLQSGATTVTRTVDLSQADTLGDIKTQLENAFAGDPVTLTVDIDPASNSGLRLTPSAGTVAVADVNGSRTATDLGIAGSAAAVINGQDLDPRLTIFTPLAALNGGTGIGPTAGTGLLLTNNQQTQAVDLSGVTTVGDLLNVLNRPEYGLQAGLNAAGNGLAVSSRVSGAKFAIGENGGTNATALGIRTLTGSTSLADLNRGEGVPVSAGPLVIQRRDGSTVQVDLSGAATVRSVLDAINAVDPGNLVASLNTVGNGIALTDNSGTGPLTVDENDVSVALGINGTESSGSGTLVGVDVNQQEPKGVLTVLLDLQRALSSGDNAGIARASRAIDAESQRLNVVRGDLGARQKLLDDVENRVLDQEIDIKAAIANEVEVDPTEVVTQLMQKQQTLQATMQMAARLFQLNLLQFL